MFDELIYESFGSSDTRRRRAALWTVGAQAALIGCMILAPLLNPETLPDQRLVASLAVPFMRAAAAPAVRTAGESGQCARKRSGERSVARSNENPPEDHHDCRTGGAPAS